MATRQLEADLFGREVRFDYSETWIGYSLLGLRLVMGWIFLQAGLDKLLQGDWSAAAYLGNAIPAGNPFGFWDALAGVPLVDPLVVWGQVLVGLALVVGVAVRWAAVCGALQMLLFWASHLEGGPLAGFPIEHGYLVSSHIVYVILLFGLGAFGAGRILGVDRWLESRSFVRNNGWLRLLLG